VWTADPCADGRRSTASQTAIVGGAYHLATPGRLFNAAVPWKQFEIVDTSVWEAMCSVQHPSTQMLEKTDDASGRFSQCDFCSNLLFSFSSSFTNVF